MDYESAQEISSSQIWEKVCKELDDWITIEMDKLRNCSPDVLPHIQATIRNYENVKRLPQIVKERLE